MRKNKCILSLTLIIIATLLIIVIGASYAYFSTLPNDAAKAPIDVTTNKLTTVNINPGAGLKLKVDANLMVKDEIDKIGGEVHTDMSNLDNVPKVTFMSFDDTKETSYCYKVEYIEDENGFTKPKESIAPELVLNVYKTTNAFTESSKRINVVKDLEITNMNEKKYLIKDGENDYHRITSSNGISKTDAWEMQLVFWNRKDFSQVYNSDTTYNGHLLFTTVTCPEANS